MPLDYVVGDLWKNSDKYLTELCADSRQLRRKTLTLILNEVTALPKDLKLRYSSPKKVRDPSVPLDSDDDQGSDDDNADKININSTAGGDVSSPLGDTPPKKQVMGVVKPLLKCLFDPVEKCRELSYESLILLFDKVPKESVIHFLPYLIPALLERLGQQELIESSEEVRLIALKLMKVIVFKVGTELAPYVDDWIRILSVTLVDPYHEIRKSSCEVTSISAKTLSAVFHYQSERLNKPLCISITHQQSKVRGAVVACIGDVLLNGNHKCIEEFIPHLTQRLFDSQPKVRQAVVGVIGSWMMDFLDRYSYFHKLLPLLITGLCDESPDVQELASKLWEKVGDKYLEENVEEFKDQVDFPSEIPDHYPENVKRPNFGCRLLSYRNACKIIPGICNDITDWVETTRQKCAQLLFHLILGCEDRITMHVEPILQCMYKSSLDPNPIVSYYIRESAKLIGYFAPLTTTGPMLHSYLSVNPSEGCLAVTASIIQGSNPELLKPFVPVITDVLATPEICQTLKTPKQFWLLQASESLINLVPEEVSKPEAQDRIFRILVNVFSLAQDGETQGKAMMVISGLKDAGGLSNVDELFVKHSGKILQEIKSVDGLWLSVTTDQLIFATILSQGGSAVEEHMDIILDILVCQLDPKKDAEVRLKLFTLLSEILANYSRIFQSKESSQRDNLQVFIKNIVQDVLGPNLVWRAGKTASALRAAASACLFTILEHKLLEPDVIRRISDDVISGCISLLDDPLHVNRLLGSQCLGQVAECCDKTLAPDATHKIYPELLKRLDDEKQDVRICAAISISQLFSNLSAEYDATFSNAHLDYLIKVLIVHLDDEDAQVQETVLETLKVVGALAPKMLVEKCEQFRLKHRSPVHCDYLVDQFKSISVK